MFPFLALDVVDAVFVEAEVVGELSEGGGALELLLVDGVDDVFGVGGWELFLVGVVVPSDGAVLELGVVGGAEG